MCVSTSPWLAYRSARDGAGRNQDKLPKKLFKPLTGGPSDGLHVTEEQMEQALDRY